MDGGMIIPVIPPAELTAYARRVLEELPVNDHLGEQFFPNAFSGSDNWTTGIQTDRDWTEEAEYRAWNTESTIGSRPGLFRITGNVVPISRKIPLQEDMIRIMRNASANNVPEQVRTQIFNDVDRLIRMVRNRIERARWEVVDKATFTIGNPGGVTYAATEHGLQMQVDFLRAAGNRFAVATKWDAAGDPLSDILAILQTARNAGQSIGALVVSQAGITALCKNAIIRDLFPTIRSQTRLSEGQLGQLFSEWGLPPILRYDAQSKRRTLTGDVVGPIVDAKRAYFLPANEFGQTLFGPSVYTGEPEVNGAGSNGGPVVFIMKTLDPLTYWTVVDAPVIPIMFQPNDTYSVQVLT
jgi:Phage major capsid protein E